MSRAVIVGSAFTKTDLPPRTLDTPFGPTVVHEAGPERYVLFRHGVPHRYLPHQIPYRANAWALQHLGVDALLVTSSVGVLSPDVPLNTPLPVTDLVWLDQRLPDGTAATMFLTPTPEQGHLVVDDLFHPGLTHRLRELLLDRRLPMGPDELVFWYAPGPRTKTRAENAFLAANGLHVNSMTLAPEVVLANELCIPTAALVVGHKPSDPQALTIDPDAVTESLADARAAVEDLVVAFLDDDFAPLPSNHLYHFEP